MLQRAAAKAREQRPGRPSRRCMTSAELNKREPVPLAVQGEHGSSIFRGMPTPAALTLRPYAPTDRDTLATLLAAPGVAEQFDMFGGAEGVELMLSDPYTPIDSVRLAFVDDEPAGFAYAIVLPGPPARWAVLRGAVLTRFRRRGIGRALHDGVVAAVLATGPLHELVMSAWQPDSGADALAGALGYVGERWMWLMDRPRGAIAEPVWPAGVSVRMLDGSDAMLQDWTDAYNDSFAQHYRYVASPIEHARELVKKPGFRGDGVLLAYRDGKVAGFCRDELFDSRGEVGTLGTVHAARGIGLGRQLLRWGVAWLQRESALPVSLLVDGENENALGLYRSEGFVVTRSRRTWARKPAVRLKLA